MKRYSLLSLLLVLALVFTACAPGGTPAAPAEEAAAPAEEAAEAPAEEAAPPDLPFEVAPEAVNPFGLEPGESVEGIFFEGGFGRGYLDNAADIFRALHPEVEMGVEGIQRVGDQLRPRFIAGDPPDVIDNSGAGNLDMAALVAEGELLDLAPLFEAPSLDSPGMTFGDTLFPGSQAAGQFDGVQRILFLTYTVSGIWHSETLFEEMGWEYPRTWDEMLEFGDMVLETTDMHPWTYQGRFPQYMVFGVLMPLVYKNGGIEAIIAMDNLEEGAFSTDAVRQSLEQLQELYTRGHIMPGTEGLTHTESQAEWLQGNAVFIPSGNWLENEMRDLTPEDFNMVVKPVPGTDESTYDSIIAWSGENFIVPTNAENPEGGLEYLRVLMSKSNAQWFAENVGSIMPVVGGTEGVELSPAVMSANAIAEASGDATFDYMWKTWYPETLGAETRDRTGDLLTGRITPDEWMEAVEAVAAQVREDPDIIKYTRE